MSQKHSGRSRRTVLPDPPPGPSPRLLVLAARGWARFAAQHASVSGGTKEKR
ncbi:hypothetical protein ACTVZO_28330 [Streptomyces sp. IBSNAI002]|uniref:hypothetical protein n=1 Tax=Streptomyces sp. IBSNAI002 TaxID=3457500 RepID=UPI003FD0FE10